METYIRKLVWQVTLLYQQVFRIKFNMNTKIQEFCLAVQQHEGWYPGTRSYRNHNPGNIKFLSQPEATGQDSGGFAVFPSYEVGFQVLYKMIERACRGRSQVYRPSDDFYQFFAKYAPSSDNNNPRQYAETVAKRIGVPPLTKIGDLIF